MHATVYCNNVQNRQSIKNPRTRRKICATKYFYCLLKSVSLCNLPLYSLHALIPLWRSERVNQGKIKIISYLNLLFSLFLASKYILLKKILKFSAHTHINLTNCRPLTERVRCLGRSKTVTVGRSEW